METFFSTISQFLLIFGVLLALPGFAMGFFSDLPLLGKLPGDLIFQRGNVIFYAPFTSSLVLSLVLTIILSVLRRGS